MIVGLALFAGCASVIGEYVGPKQLVRHEHCEEAARLARALDRLGDDITNPEITQDEFREILEAGIQIQESLTIEEEGCLGPVKKEVGA